MICIMALLSGCTKSTISISSFPSSAIIEINGTVVGATPLKITVDNSKKIEAQIVAIPYKEGQIIQKMLLETPPIPKNILFDLLLDTSVAIQEDSVINPHEWDTVSAVTVMVSPIIYFPFDSFTLSASVQKSLDTFALYLQQQDTPLHLLISGYADDRGSEEYNLSLSHKRALAVKQYLSEKKYGVSHQFTCAVYGEIEGVIPGVALVKREYNRFVIIKVMMSGTSAKGK